MAAHDNYPPVYAITNIATGLQLPHLVSKEHDSIVRLPSQCSSHTLSDRETELRFTVTVQLMGYFIKRQSILFKRLFPPEGQDWRGSTKWLVLSPFLSGGEMPGENPGEKPSLRI